jgi:hypothetical protein
MPTTNKRIAVTLSPPLAGVLARLSTVTGIPVASVARSFLEEAVPVMQELADVLETKDRPELLAERWAGMVARLEGRMAELPRDPYA